MNPEKTIEEILHHFDPKLNSGNDFEIILEKDEENPVPNKIYFDSQRLKQTIFLILTNAFKFTKNNKGKV